MIDNKLVSFGNRFYPIVVIFDRENRSDSSDLIIQSVCMPFTRISIAEIY